MKNIWTFLGIKISNMVSESLVLYAILYITAKGWRFLIFDRQLSLGWVTQSGYQETSKVTINLLSLTMTVFSLLPAIIVCMLLFVVDFKLDLRRTFRIFQMAFYPFIFFGAIGLGVQYEEMGINLEGFELPVILMVYPVVYLIKRLNQKIYPQLGESLVKEDTRFQQENERVYLSAHPWLKLDLSRYSPTVIPFVNLVVFTLVGVLTLVVAITGAIKNPIENGVVSLLVIGLIVFGWLIRKSYFVEVVKKFNTKPR